MDICGVALTHSFYYVNADVPPIDGYDLMRRAKLIVDTDSSEVWSKLSTVSNKVHWPDLKYVSAQPSSSTETEHVHPVVSHEQHLFTDSASDNFITNCANTGTVSSSTVSEAVLTSHANKGISSSQHSHSRVAHDTTSLSQSQVNMGDTCAENKPLNPEASPFLSVHPQTVTDDTDQTDDLPAHINLLYETTVSQTTLSHEVDRQFKQMLHKHKTVFASSSTDLGFCSILQHDIDTGQSPPIKQSPRRPPLSAGDAENDIINEMLEAGVIETSYSEWASPVCLVKKPDGTYRFCIDYRRVNAVSRKDAFPVPDLHDALDHLRGARWFATLDLLSGYWQLGMTQRAKERSAFCTRRGLFQFCRMPFGLCGAPATFCRLMSIVLRDHIGVICLCYLDDVIIFGKTQAELLNRLDAVLSRLTECGLKVKPSKCVLFRTEIKFLGHLVTASGVQPLPDKVAAIKDWPTPRCLRDVRAFVGLIGYYRRFISGFADKAEPLTRLTKKGTRFAWTSETDAAYCRLEQAMIDVPTLAYPLPDRPCILDTDSSDMAYGSVLSQVVDGQERPIAYFSRVLSTSQQNYCATRRELLAAIMSLQHFRHYLLNVPVILRTDHHSLKWLKTFKRPEGILARWIETLSEFLITIEHRPGRVHSNADGLSRQHCKQCCGKLPKQPWIDELERADECAAPLGLHALQLLPELTSEELAELQKDDTVLSSIIAWFELDYEPTLDDLRELPPDGRKLWSIRSSLTFVDRVLVRKTTSDHQLVVPEALKRRLFEQTHAGLLAAHLGSDRTISQLKTSYYWPGMHKDVTAWCHACEVCACSRGPPPRAHAKMTKVIAAAPLDMVAIDILSGLPTATNGATCILVVVDYMTKWAEA